jgi:hypothetical protein
MFQTLHHLNVTGNLDDSTLKKMASPRCGLPDIILEGGQFQVSNPAAGSKVGKLETKNNDQSQTGSPAFSPPLRWNKTNLKYKIMNAYPGGIKENQIRSELKLAFGYWSEVGKQSGKGLNFEELDAKSPVQADLLIEFVKLDHRDNYPFDGRGGELAHAFFPQNGRIHFDTDEAFTLNSTDFNFRMVATHEIGHALGIDHLFEKGSLMYPYYSGYVEGDPLTYADKDALWSLYGWLKFYQLFI